MRYEEPRADSAILLYALIFIILFSFGACNPQENCTALRRIEYVVPGRKLGCWMSTTRWQNLNNAMDWLFDAPGTKR
jgi:hypothetical protein